MYKMKNKITAPVSLLEFKQIQACITHIYEEDNASGTPPMLELQPSSRKGNKYKWSNYKSDFLAICHWKLLRGSSSIISY